jgi:predicted transcriptional regulator
VINEKIKPESYISSTYADHLKQKRKELNLNAEEAANIIGTSIRTLRGLEGGWDVHLKFNSFMKMAKLYEFTIHIPSDQNESVRVTPVSKVKMDIISQIQQLDHSQLNLLKALIKQFKEPVNSKSAHGNEDLSNEQVVLISDITQLPSNQLSIIKDIVDEFTKE